MAHWKSPLGRGGNHSSWTTFIMGSFFGFFVSSTLSGILSLHIFSGDQAASLDMTTTALRALAAVRHFPETNGWGLIHVFYGDNSQLPQQYAGIGTVNPDGSATPSNWFGALQQDNLVSQLLNGKRGGFFVDLTANHAYKASKTYALEIHYGWNGLCVEPNPDYWESLSHRTCDVVGAHLGSSRMQEENANGHDASEEIHLHHTVQLREILERLEAPRVIDYLSIGNIMNGGEGSVLETFPFDRYRFNVITMEGSGEDKHELLDEKGYIKLLQMKHAVRESLWIHRSVQHTVNMTALARWHSSEN